MRKKFKPRLKICVSGSAAGDCLNHWVKKKAELVGEQIARSGAVLTSGVTTGLPQDAARGAKRVGGLVIGFSPGATKSDHLRKYRLPLDYHDVVVFTGAGYAGRNLILTRSSDAVIVVCGRIGTLNEFTVAFEDRKVIGVLDHSGGISDEIDDILNVAKRGKGHVVFDADPKRLVKKVIIEVARADRQRHRGNKDDA